MKQIGYMLLFLLITISMLNFVSAQEINDTQEVIVNTNDNQIIETQNEIVNNEKTDNDLTEFKESAETNDSSEVEGCCSTILQGYNNDSAISFRRDETHKVTLNVKHNSSFIKQYKTGVYSFHIIVSKDGWLVGTGGADNEYVNKNVESNALTMINNNYISQKNMNNIYNLVSGLSVGHFVIKAPNGTYSLFIKRSRTYKESGVLKAGQYLVVPNHPDYFNKGSFSNILDEKAMISSSRLLAARDKYGSNRREIVTYYYKNNIYNSTVKVSITNDNGKYVNKRSSGLIDNVQTNDKYYSSSSIPIIDNYLNIDQVNFFIKNPIIPTKFILNKVNKVEYGEDAVISGRYVDNKTNNLTYTPLKLVINSREYAVKTDGHGIFNYKYKTGAIGINNVSISYPGNSRYKGAEEKFTFNVTRRTSKIIMDKVLNTQYGDNVVVSGRYVDLNGTNLTYTPLDLVINSKKYAVKTDGHGYFKYTFKASIMGINSVSISYPGNSRYNGTEEKITFNVTKRSTKIVLDKVLNTQYGDNVVVSGRYVDLNGTNLTYTPLDLVINSKKYAVKTDGHGYFKYTYKASSMGINSVSISYPGNSRYNGTEEKITFNVTKRSTKIIINPLENTQYGGSVIISGRYIDTNGTNLTYTPLKLVINTKEYAVKTNKYGIFNFTYSTEKIGSNNIQVSYEGNSRYAGTTVNATLYVITRQTKIIISNVTGNGNNIKITGKYMDISGNKLTYTPLTVNVDNNITTVKTNGNGDFVYEYCPGETLTKITISYHGNKRYAGTSQSIAYTINDSSVSFSKSTIMTLNKIENVKCSNVVKISGKYVDKDGTNLTYTPVKINVNGKIYNTKTDAKGYFTISCLAEKVGVNNVIASYHGNMGYSGTTTETAFMVLKA